jgi:hypothetical protein
MPDRATRHTTKNIAAADHDRHFHAHVRVTSAISSTMRTMVARLMPKCVVSHERLTGQLEQDPLVGWLAASGHE